jgi:glycerophosphoryl diester phosphodiesterase
MSIEQIKIIAHRGLWDAKTASNSQSALKNALQAGYGVETDLRLSPDGQIIISHDPITCDCKDWPTLQWLLELHHILSSTSVLALNIKSDGLHPFIRQEISMFDESLYFLFDMSVPDLLSGTKHGLRQFARASCYEDPLPFLSTTSGVWVDCFTDSYPTENDLHAIATQFNEIAIVSPELHKRDHLPFWSMIKTVYWPQNTKLMLCTDYPDQASSFFSVLNHDH